MKNIVFRGRRKDTGDWVEGNYTHNFRKGEWHGITDFEHNVTHRIYRESLEMEDYNNEFRTL